MAGLVPAIHAAPRRRALPSATEPLGADGRDKPGHDAIALVQLAKGARAQLRRRWHSGYRHSLTSTNRPAIAAAAAIAGETRWVRPL